MYLNIKTKEYPRFQGDLELLGWEVGQPLPSDWVAVSPADWPTKVPNGKKVIEEFPILISGVWTQIFKIIDLTTEELEQRDAPDSAKAKLKALGLTDVEIAALAKGLVR